MRKFWAFLWQEEIPQAMGLAFVMMAFCATAVVLATPFQLQEPARALYYATRDPMKNLWFIIGFALAGALLAGIAMCLVSLIHQWELQRE